MLVGLLSLSAMTILVLLEAETGENRSTKDHSSNHVSHIDGAHGETVPTIICDLCNHRSFLVHGRTLRR